MSSQGPLSPGTATNVASFSNPNNIKVSDNVYATGSDFCNLTATNFGFSIPSGATIDGILFEVEAKDPDGSFIREIYIIKSDGTQGSQKGLVFTGVNGTDTYYPYGGSSDLWGLSWTAEDINDVDFGVAVNCRTFDTTIYIDHVRCTVYYTEGGGSANTGFFGLM